jgi:osmotically-inducible protein OsmY
LVGGTVTTAAVVLPQERSVGKIIDDNAIWVKLKADYEVSRRFNKISVSISDSRVLLTGSVGDSLDRIEASRMAWDANGVKEVINELEIAEKEQSFSESAWITAQIKFALLVKGNIRSVNYSIETYNNVVYLMGIAQSSEELRKVIEIIQKVPKVEKVISYVKLKESRKTK